MGKSAGCMSRKMGAQILSVHMERQCDCRPVTLALQEADRRIFGQCSPGHSQNRTDFRCGPWFLLRDEVEFLLLKTMHI